MTERFNVSGALLVKLFGTPSVEQRGFEGKAGAGARHRRHLERCTAAIFYSAMFLLTSLATALVYGWGGVLAVARRARRRHGGGAHGVPQRLYGPLTALSNVQVDVMTALVSFDRVFEVLDLEPMIDEQARRGRRRRAARPGSSSTTSTSATRRADEVSLASLESVAVLDQTPNHQVLFDVSFTAEPGQLVALVGPSGAGKTTISHLVPRLYDVRAGAVRINGVDVRDATLASMRDDDRRGHPGRAPVPRDHPRRTSTTRGPTPPRTRSRDALRAAQILPLIESLPDGLDTVVGDRGYRLSGGEKQRIAIARLLLKAPRHRRARRSHRAPRLRVGGRGAACARNRAHRSHLDRDRAPPVHRARRRPDPGRRRRAASSSAARTTSCSARGGLYADLYETQFKPQATMEELSATQ